MQSVRVEKWTSPGPVFRAIVATLIIFPPFALGAVHPWPAAIVEVLVLILVILWAVRIGTSPSYNEWWPSQIDYLMIPVLLLGSLFVFQLVPLPPRVIGAISPSTYNLYARSLKAWPAAVPYSGSPFGEDRPAKVTVTASRWRKLPSLGERRPGAVAPFIGIESRASDTLAITNSQQSRDPSNIHTRRTVFELLPTWYSLSLSPDLTASAALRFAAYAGLFFAVVAYPFANENEGERRL